MEKLKKGFGKAGLMIKNFFVKAASIFKGIRKKIRKNKWAALLIDFLSTVLMFAIAGGIGVFIALGKHAGSAELTAKEYCEAYIEQNWAAMYELLDIEESEFVNYDAFERMMEGKIAYGVFSEPEVTLKKKSGNYSYVDVSYTDEETGKKTTFSVVMKKQKEKVYKFFSTWKIDGTPYVIEDININVPEDVDITFDSKDISAYLQENADGRNIYSVDRAFSGDHDIGIDTVYIDTYTEALCIEEDNYQYNVNYTDFEMKQDDFNYIEEATAKIVFGVYSNALNDSGVEELKVYFGESEEEQSILLNCYDAMYGSINQDNGAMLKTMSVDTYKVYRFSYSYPNRVEMRVDFNCTYEAKTGRTMINGVRGSYEGTAASTAKVIFALKDGKWLVDSMEIKCFDYSPPEN